MSKKPPVRAIFDNLSSLTTDHIITSEQFKKLLQRETHVAIERAMQDKKVYATLFEINTTGTYVEIHKRQWPDALEACLLWYVEEEDYTTCTHIRELIRKLRQYHGKKTITVTKDDTDARL
jgi:hypothetical protein